MGSSYSKLLDEIADATDDTDKTFETDDMPRAVKVDHEKLEKQYKLYKEVMLIKDEKKPYIRREKEIDMDKKRLKAFLEGFKSQTPEMEVDDFPAFKTLEKCATDGWQFGDKRVKEAPPEQSENKRCVLYYNIKRDAAEKFSVLIYFLVTGRSNENHFVLYAGLIEQKLVHKKKVSKDKYEFYLTV